MLNRRAGVTLLEVLVSLVLLGLIGIATTRVLQATFGATGRQMAMAAAHGAARVGALALPQEFREVGFDSVPWPGGIATSDLEAIGPRSLRFRAMRGLGITCGTPTLQEFRVRRPLLGLRPPLPTDGVLLFVENTRGIAQDDQWVLLDVAAIDLASQCNGDPAIAFRLSRAPEVAPGVPMTLSQHFVGGPVRWFERIEYGPWVDASGRAFIGVRSVSLAEPELAPAVGPLPGPAAFRFEYFDAAGNGLDPASASPLLVRSIGVVITGLGAGSASTGGPAGGQVTVAGRAALRNTLRP